MSEELAREFEDKYFERFLEGHGLADTYKLKACPFCSSDSVFQLRHGVTGRWVCQCNSCQAQSGYNFNRTESRRAWNTRPEPAK